MTTAFVPGQAQPVRDRTGTEVRFILALFSIRWLAGILENYGVRSLSEVGAVVMLGGLAILLLQRMRLAREVALFVAGIIAWVASGLLSYAANPQADPQATITLLTLLILYGLFANATFTFFRTRQALDDLGRVIALFIIVGLLLSLTQMLTGTGFVAAGKVTTQRAFGSDVHPVSFAVQILAAMVALEMLRVKRRLRFGLSHSVLLGMGGITLYLTYARTAWVMALIILALAIILRGSLARRITIGAIAGVGGAIILLSSDRFTDLGSLPFFLENFSFQDAVFDWRYVDNSVSWRIVNWSYGLQQALEQPWLGFGPGQSAVSSYFNLEMHNIFLEVFFEGGFFGLGALIVTVLGLVRMHAHLPAVDAADRYARILANSFGFTLLLAVTFSTSFVDQLMSFLLYVFIVAAAAIPANSASDPA